MKNNKYQRTRIVWSWSLLVDLNYLSALSSDICPVEVDCSLSLIKAEVRDFSELKGRFPNDEQA